MQPHPVRYSVYVSLVALFVWSMFPQSIQAQQSYYQTNLVSDGFVPANNIDPSLVNPWGLVQTSGSPFWVSDEGANLSTLYSGSGVKNTAITVGFSTSATPPNGPTGVVANTGTGFIPTGSTTASHFIFDDLNGNIYGWNSGSMAVEDATVSGGHLTGLAINSTGADIFAANFTAGTGGIVEFNSSWTQLSTAFTDPTLPSGYEPYNVEDMNGTLYVAYEPIGTNGQPTRGTGDGLIAEFSESGTFIKNLISGGSLDDPWGMALAPSDFGEFSDDLLVGNFGNGEINAFNPTTGALLGTIDDLSGNPITDSDLWALMFGTGGDGSSPSTLYVTAGLNNQADGLLAAIDPTPEPATLLLFGSGLLGIFYVLRRQREAA
jgi:uncharacterized protein (TIGR03118 family)